MSENESNVSTSRPAKPPKVKGIDAPFADTDKLPEGVDAETRLFHGVDPDTKERVSVTIEGLKAEFGDKLGEEKYLKLAGLGGGSIFFNPHAEATNFRPPLGLSHLKGKHKEQAAAILAAKE